MSCWYIRQSSNRSRNWASSVLGLLEIHVSVFYYDCINLRWVQGWISTHLWYHFVRIVLQNRHKRLKKLYLVYLFNIFLRIFHILLEICRIPKEKWFFQNVLTTSKFRYSFSYRTSHILIFNLTKNILKKKDNKLSVKSNHKFIKIEK